MASTGGKHVLGVSWRTTVREFDHVMDGVCDPSTFGAVVEDERAKWVIEQEASSG